ncbi:SNF2-like, N-terminal domain superfamily [Sesbania bispinosa]|nr:SNF2-like, N-terminal domain superfamily [Sesbania bispinosa]
MAKALRECTGILILDEGHNPRSTKSRLRKGLMKVETELRILLSSTLFQNYFCEYFNTLCLARPKFVQEVLKELDIKQKKGNDKNPEKTQHLLETRARKFFLDDITNKIDSSDDEVRMQGLNMLRKITIGFVDVYESGKSDKLPETAKENGWVQCVPFGGRAYGNPWINASMVDQTATSADKFYTSQELNQLEKFKYDFRVWSKVRFILSLIFRVVKEDKVLIFCRNLAPMKLLVQLFEEFFKWKKDLFMGKKTSCAEGISLTASFSIDIFGLEVESVEDKAGYCKGFFVLARKRWFMCINSWQKAQWRKISIAEPLGKNGFPT